MPKLTSPSHLNTIGLKTSETSHETGHLDDPGVALQGRGSSGGAGVGGEEEEEENWQERREELRDLEEKRGSFSTFLEQ